MKKSIKVLVSVLVVVMLAVACVSLVACNDDANSSTKKINMINIELSSEQYGFCFKKTDTELKNSVNEILENKSTEISAIMDKYLGATADELASFGIAVETTPSDSENELVVATNAEFAPFEYKNGSKFAGIDIEIAQLLADELGKTLVVVHMDFDAVVLSVEEQAIYDIGMAALTETEDRLQHVDFSNPYFDTTQVLLTKANTVTPFDYCTSNDEIAEVLRSLTGVKVGGQSGTTGQQYFKGNEAFGFEGYENIEFLGYDAPAQAVQSMLDGNIDYVVVDKAIAISLLKNYNK